MDPLLSKQMHITAASSSSFGILNWRLYRTIVVGESEEFDGVESESGYVAENMDLNFR